MGKSKKTRLFPINLNYPLTYPPQYDILLYDKNLIKSGCVPYGGGLVPMQPGNLSVPARKRCYFLR